MQGHTIKYPRGSVWLCRDDEFINNGPFSFKSGTHVQRKTRPVLIISNDLGNSRSPVLNVIPLTSQDKRSSVTVPICDEDGTLGCILCNQIKTIDKSQLIKYEFMLDSETIAEVERTLQFTLGIELQSIDNSLENIKSTIDNIVTMKFNQIFTRKEFDNIVEYIARNLENTYSQLMKKYVENIKVAEKRIINESKLLHTKTNNDKNVSGVELDDVNNNKHIETNKKEKRSKMKPRGYWTTEVKLQFIDDFNKLTIDKIMDKYGFDTEKQAKKRFWNYSYDMRKMNNSINNNGDDA